MDQEIGSETPISKFVINDKSIYVKLLWEENEEDMFHITVFDGTHSWSGRFSNELAEKCRSSLEETEDDYKINVKKAFFGTHEGYIYDFVVLQDDNARFSWKKVFDDSTIMAHGQVRVVRDDVAKSKDTLIDFLLCENNDLREIIEMLNRRNEALTENLDKCKVEMEQFVHMKMQLETSLYGKFAQLLNEKKKRICLLEENIQMFG